MEHTHETQLEPSGDMAELIKRAVELTGELNATKATQKKLQSELDDVEMKIMRVMELLGQTKFSAHGYTFYTHTSMSVQTPKTPEEKEMLFDWLREKGIFAEIVGVNSQTLNKLYRDFADEALARGELEFQIGRAHV